MDNLKRRSKFKFDSFFIQHYDFKSLSKTIFCPFSLCNCGKKSKAYHSDVARLKTDISLENIMESIIKLKYHVAKIKAEQRTTPYEQNMGI